jgi:hypothetical protein
MVTSIAIYMEGGGPTSATREPFRRGISTFLAPVVTEARKRRMRWRAIICGGRKEAYDKFCDALAKEPHVFNILLVDSEAPVVIGLSPWTHLRKRPGDGWQQPAGADDSRCQMMVACMEAWFLADRAAMNKHFGSHFDIRKLPALGQAETRTKKQIENALKQATRKTVAKEYRKIRDGAKLLASVDPTEVRKHCKWCDRLFASLEQAVGSDP